MSQTETATFAAGCFWGVEATFRQIPGVISTEVGYAGGTKVNPTYKDVCSGATGHAESVQVVFDPTIVTYGQLVDAFWEMHDPTTLNRQGPDFGTQYRSVIFTHSPEQEATANASREKAGPQFRRPIVTEIVPAGTFYAGEDYHQRYFEKRGISHCSI
jgi:peptide-methionine (S)-S-oxide reductase